jgi:hypothetical protein
MFRPIARQSKMTDPERGYTWEWVRGVTYESASQVVLTMNGRTISYAYDRRQRDDEEQPWFDAEVFRFGSIVDGVPRFAVEAEDWAVDSEREAEVLTAIEAVIAYTSGGETLSRGDGYTRATFRGVQYRLSDFGAYFEAHGTR